MKRDVMEKRDYRAILRDEYSARRARNPSYSLRAFARDIGIASSRVSDCLLKRQGLSVRVASQISRRLKFNPARTELFCTLVEAEHGRSEASRAAARLRLRKFESDPDFQLNDEIFKVVSEWQHFAIIELLRVKGAKCDEKWIAKRLKLTVVEARFAIQRLLKVGLLKIESDGLVPTHQFIASPNEIPSDAIRKYHDAILIKAHQALHEQPVETRDFSAVNVVVSADQLGEAKKRIRDFRREFVKKVEEGAPGEKVYNLSIQFFSIDEGEVT
jgi:uncharacterized protein (TIGR02147 family)